MDFPTKSLLRPIKRQGRSRDTARGFTLPELMIALTILALVLTGAYSAFFSFSKGAKVSLEHMDHTTRTQFAFESIHKAIRAVSDVHQTSSQTFEFTTTNMDGNKERIRIYYYPQIQCLIERSISNGDHERVLLDAVKSVQFTYYDRFGNTTNTQVDMNAAKLEVVSEREAMGGTSDIETETAIITFRNHSL